MKGEMRYLYSFVDRAAQDLDVLGLYTPSKGTLPKVGSLLTDSLALFRHRLVSDGKHISWARR